MHPLKNLWQVTTVALDRLYTSGPLRLHTTDGAAQIIRHNICLHVSSGRYNRNKLHLAVLAPAHFTDHFVIVLIPVVPLVMMSGNDGQMSTRRSG
jgi:hypothetical protein